MRLEGEKQFLYYRPHDFYSNAGIIRLVVYARNIYVWASEYEIVFQNHEIRADAQI